MEIRIDDGETVQFCDFAEFIADNGYEADEAAEIAQHLKAGETFSVGGGAAPLFHITACLTGPLPMTTSTDKQLTGPSSQHTDAPAPSVRCVSGGRPREPAVSGLTKAENRAFLRMSRLYRNGRLPETERRVYEALRERVRATMPPRSQP